MEKEKTSTTMTELMAEMDTVTELIAEMDEEDRLLLKETNDVQPVIHQVDSSEFLPEELNKVYIAEVLRKNNMLVKGSDLPSSFADEYRRIKRPLLSNAFGKSASLIENGNLILVTSSIPGEGKTHTSINLALSITHERDHTVLLIDCDVTRRGTSLALGIEDKPGLIETLENDEFSIGDAILHTDIPGLCLISAGKQHDFVTELLASQRMSKFMSEINDRYNNRIIILDGPPLLSTPQAQVLSNIVGQVVFVIEAGKTPQSVVEEALDLIPEEQATGVVINKCEGISSRGSYYYDKK